MTEGEGREMAVTKAFAHTYGLEGPEAIAAIQGTAIHHGITDRPGRVHRFHSMTRARVLYEQGMLAYVEQGAYEGFVILLRAQRACSPHPRLHARITRLVEAIRVKHNFWTRSARRLAPAPATTPPPWPSLWRALAVVVVGWWVALRWRLHRRSSRKAHEARQR